MAFDFKKEEDVKDYLKNIYVEYSFGCYSEKRPDGCHLLADYYEAVKKDFVSGAKLFKKTCDEFDFAKSCYSYGSHALLGKGLPKSDPTEAMNYFAKSCDLDHPEGCCNAGIMSVSSIDKQKDLQNYDKGIAMLEKGCSLGCANACFYLSGFFLSGSQDEKVPKDMGRAFKYATLGCDLNNIYACVNLSIMYKKGDGVEKNEDMSNRMKKKALELQNEMNDNLTHNFQRGPNN